MPKSEQVIPTLTDIIKVGDASMLNHFNAHALQDYNNQNSHIQAENASSFENGSSNEHMFADGTGDVSMDEPVIINDSSDKVIDEPLEISLENELHNYQSMNTDSSEAHEDEQEWSKPEALSTPSVEDSRPDEAQTANISRGDIDELVSEMLPEFEDMIRQALYKKFRL